MTEKYLLNLSQEQGGYNHVQKDACAYVPKTNYEEFGVFYAASSAVVAAKLKYPYRKIKGCYYCFGMS
jgi:hypothetical protein